MVPDDARSSSARMLSLCTCDTTAEGELAKLRESIKQHQLLVVRTKGIPIMVIAKTDNAQVVQDRLRINAFTAHPLLIALFGDLRDCCLILSRMFSRFSVLHLMTRHKTYAHGYLPLLRRDFPSRYCIGKLDTNPS